MFYNRANRNNQKRIAQRFCNTKMTTIKPIIKFSLKNNRDLMKLILNKMYYE